MSVDLRTLKPDYKAILKNKKIIAVNQDPLGIQGRRIYKQKGIEIWARPIMPVYRAKYSYAIVFLNRRTDGTPSEVSVTLKELGLDNPTGYHIEDLYDDHIYGVVTPDRRFKVDVNPSGSVVMIRCDIVKGKMAQPQSLNKPPWDPTPRNADGFVLDLGNIGFRGGNAQYPQIRGDNYVDPDPLGLQSAGPPQTRAFRNTQQQQQQQQQPAYPPANLPAYPTNYNQDLSYNYQNINGNYQNINGKK